MKINGIYQRTPEYEAECRAHTAKWDAHIEAVRATETPEQTAVNDLINPLRSERSGVVRTGAIQHHLRKGTLTLEMLRAARESAERREDHAPPGEAETSPSE